MQPTSVHISIEEAEQIIGRYARERLGGSGACSYLPRQGVFQCRSDDESLDEEELQRRFDADFPPPRPDPGYLTPPSLPLL